MMQIYLIYKQMLMDQVINYIFILKQLNQPELGVFNINKKIHVMFKGIIFLYL